MLGLAAGIAAWLATAAPAGAVVSHVVQEGETLSGVAYANGLTTDALAVANGLDAEAYLIAGETIQVPAPGETVTATTTTSGTGYVVQAGDTLSGIAYANGLTTDSLAAANGLSVDGLLLAGATLTISGTAGTSTAITTGPSASLGLAAGAAENWDAMHATALEAYGVDLQSAGPLSGYRTYDEQAYLYDLYLSGLGEPANPPGTSTHELGVAVGTSPTPACGRSSTRSAGSTGGPGRSRPSGGTWSTSADRGRNVAR